jgi:hypothetical protein
MTGNRLASAAAVLALLALPTAASAKGHSRDSDRDGMPNIWERANHLNAKKANAGGDPDRDGLRNLSEYKLHSDPHNPDTNGNGTPDGRDVAGTVASFTNGILTINLPDGSTRAGAVNDGTDVECKTAQPATPAAPTVAGARAARHGSDDSGSDDSGDDDGPASAPAPANTTVNAGDEDSPGDDDNEGEDRQGNHGDRSQDTCAPGALVAGAKVHEAELSISSAGATWDKVELLLP